MLRAYHFTHQHGARRPLAAEAKSHQCTEDEKLRVSLRKPTQEREKGEPDDGDLQRAHAPETVRKGARKPAAEGGGEQRRGADQPGIRIGNREGDDDCRDREAENLHIHGVERPPAETRPESALLTRLELPVPSCRTVIYACHVFLPYIPARPAPFVDLDLSCTAHAEEYLREEDFFHHRA